MSDIISRAEWGARRPKGSYTQVASAKGVKVHYLGGALNPAALDDHDRCLKVIRDVQAFHMDGRGWLDFAYSMAVCVHRRVIMGRGPHHLTAANGSGLNTQHYSVLAILGNKGLVEPNDDLLHGVLDAIDYLREEGGAGREIKGHRDGYATDCPGGPLYAWVRAGARRPGSPPPDPDAWPGRLLRYPSGVAGTPLMSGPDVRQWQEQMKTKHGFELDVDGRYGPRSRAVCLAFQRQVDLDDDGIVGRLTWEAAFGIFPAQIYTPLTSPSMTTRSRRALTEREEEPGEWGQ
ncbi:N-acetylmuramoyl-L-alanine amidase [Acrocarpospora macrocephala]|uniref:N-acetylmuramoyl-L-alanine amidase n=1 Tax=Acrocarpospora macrocephala TaxID=150177 RepID=A0A5M3WJA3_9ACTN|nr:peptidoglycan-binding domain-containing protein [Acrocarpospora macrocephala]GES09275.1 N-acetylmuramoyl-L-alanine amidase [Acrocarpospora macrocephala]